MIDYSIPSSFDNFRQRQLASGLETKSETDYKGYRIVLRAYTSHGISGKIFKVLESGKRIMLRERNYNFFLPVELLQQMKNYIDNYEINLITKLNKLT